MTQNKKAEELRREILQKVESYYEAAFGQPEEFVPGESRIAYAGRVFDKNEVLKLVDSSLDFWLTYGRYSKQFEDKLASYLGAKHCLLVNSGSSANLLAFMALTSDRLEERKINRGDEIITVAAGFPTTVAPIVQYGAVPVFVDIEMETTNIDVTYLEEALSNKTKAVMLAHTLGNPFNIKAIKQFCDKNNLWLIEDNCDALGSTYEGKVTGTFGDIGTSSFYPPHHMTMGEGGAVYTNNASLYRVLLSLRDWGRDCHCPSGVDNTCGQRFDRSFGELPHGYDHKYVYSHFGYNLKVSDMQAAVGCAQLDKLPKFVEARKRNWNILNKSLVDAQDIFVLPEATEGSDPSWFGFLLTVKENALFSRGEIVNYLESKNIQTRTLFAGNFIKHPSFNQMREKQEGFRVAGDLTNTDRIMNNAFWIGVYPGMTETMVHYMAENIHAFLNERCKSSV